MGKRAEPADNADPGKANQERVEVNKTLRLLRAEISDLNGLVGRVRAGRATDKDHADYVTKTVADVEVLMAELETRNKDRRSDSIRHIQNVWEQMRVNPVLHSPHQDPQTQEHLHHLTLIEEHAREILLAMGLFTIPFRLNRGLGKLRPGHYLPFHMLFEDELPSLKDCAWVLQPIAGAPDAVNRGIVNAGTGLV